MANKTKYAGDLELIHWSLIQSSSFLDLVIKECRLTRASSLLEHEKRILFHTALVKMSGGENT